MPGRKKKRRKPLPARIRMDDVHAARGDLRTIATDLHGNADGVIDLIAKVQGGLDRHMQHIQHCKSRLAATEALLDDLPPPKSRGNGH